LRCRMKSFKARSTRVCSGGAPGRCKNRVRVSPWPCLEAIALPTALLGSTRRASTCWSSQPVSASLRGRL
jgi:hypothetical protein